jgi:hypothetical protein
LPDDPPTPVLDLKHPYPTWPYDDHVNVVARTLTQAVYNVTLGI